MLDSTPTQPAETPAAESRPRGGALVRLARHVLGKALLLLVTVAVGMYLTILLVNLGGFVDNVFKANIAENIGARILGGWLKDEPEPGRTQIIEQTMWDMEEAMGLHQPFLLRSLRWLGNSLRLDLGNTYLYFFNISFSGSVHQAVERFLPYTLLLTGLTNLFFFIGSVSLAMLVTRKYGGWLDRLMALFSALSAAPSWIYGVILIFIFAGQLALLPYPRALNMQEIAFTPHNALIVLQYMMLPAAAIFLSTFFQGVYTWRTFLLIYANEDYVEMARARGLRSDVVDRKYILRPVLPYLLTNFAMLMIGMWQNAIALEVLFRWTGIGALFIQAASGFNTPLTLGIVVTFAYLLAITVFILDFFYAMLDPRIRIGSQGERLRLAQGRRKHPAQAKTSSNTASTQAPARPSWTELPTQAASRPPLRQRLGTWWRRMCQPHPSLREILRSPTALIGLVIIIAAITAAVYVVYAIPYKQAVSLWSGKIEDWYTYPENALPAWVNLFRKEKLPLTIYLDSRTLNPTAEAHQLSGGMYQTTFPFSFDFPYDALPSDLVFYLEAQYREKQPFLIFTWTTPDGRQLDLGKLVVGGQDMTYYLSREKPLQRKLGDKPVLEALFTLPDAEKPPEGENPSKGYKPLVQRGSYRLDLTVFTFEPDARVRAEFLLYGRVSGLAGTDFQRRDLLLALLWGLPVALAFGLLGALASNLAAVILAAAGAWFSGWVDDLIQRISEINMILPSLLIAIMVYLMYSKSIWTILGVIVLLNIFGNMIKSYRAIFMEVRESPYIEAASAYGASSWRIITRYLVPRILPVLIPQMVITVPVYVFYEATLAYLGVSDPYLPTWGKIIYQALTSGALQRYYYWFLEPITLLFITGLGFALLGFALDRILNPRLKTE
jgi:peptide/nickel transport system permease protein